MVVNKKVDKSKKVRGEGYCNTKPEPQTWNTMRVTVDAVNSAVRVTVNGQNVQMKNPIQMKHKLRAAAGVVIRKKHGYNAYFRSFEVNGKNKSQCSSVVGVKLISIVAVI